MLTDTTGKTNGIATEAITAGHRGGNDDKEAVAAAAAAVEMHRRLTGLAGLL